MERLKHVKDTLLCAVESQLGDLAHVDAKELGEVVDMVKDMEEAMYYCSIVKCMEKKEKEEEENKYSSYMHYIPMPLYYPSERGMYRDLDRGLGRMYYHEGMLMDRDKEMEGHDKEGRDTRDRMEHSRDRIMNKYPTEIRDVREGRSPISRKNYMESKEMHHGAPAQMKELEKYMQELTQDITEMIHDASPEEKALLQQKLSTLATKIK